MILTFQFLVMTSLGLSLLLYSGRCGDTSSLLMTICWFSNMIRSRNGSVCGVDVDADVDDVRTHAAFVRLFLPHQWLKHVDEQGRPYYYSADGSRSEWELPKVS